MEEPQIRDIPSLQKLLKDLNSMKSIKGCMPLLRPLLILFGVNVVQMDEALRKVGEIERMALEMATIPDRFNDLFASRGWIIYDYLNLDTVKAALGKAEAGDIDGAEEDLVSYYTSDTVRRHLQTMIGIKAFRPRMQLAQKALLDYQEERYHACIPVVLALLDGLVNELHEKRRGFFAEGVTLEAWDSVAAHSKGLGQLVRVFSRMRQTTTTEALSIPYRNGIMHGMDLGYDNKIVAAKTWAALFAVREWAAKAESGSLVAPAPEPQKTWRDLVQQLQSLSEDKSRLEAWSPRVVQLGDNIPITGLPEDFQENTPERRLAEFLNCWARRNYGYMVKALPVKTSTPTKKLPLRIRDVYAKKLLKRFEFTDICDQAGAVTLIQTKIVYEEDGKEAETSKEFRLINEDAAGHPCVRGKPGTSWTIYNWESI